MKGYVMDCGRCYLNKPIENIIDSITSLNSFRENLSGELPVDDKVYALNRLFYLLNEKIPLELREVVWAVRTLDMEKDRKILTAAFKALNDLQIGLQKVKSCASKEENFADAAEIMSAVHALSERELAAAVFCTHAKVAKLDSTDLPTIRTMDGAGQITTEDADLMLSKESELDLSTTILNAFSYGFNSLTNAQNHMVFTLGKYYNPIPCLVTSYHFETSANVPSRVADIISMLKGEEMSVTPKAIFLDDGPIPDRHGEFVLVPSVFAADLARMKHFTINAVSYYDQAEFLKTDAYNPNECAREIFRLLGKVGGERFMQVCQQGMMAYFLGQIVFPLISPGGAWEVLLPEKFLNPENASGFIVDLQVDYENNLLMCSRKLLMKLHTVEDPTFTAHFVAKTLISISLEELTRSDLMENENPVPNLRVTDIISTLVINNPAEAEELLEKF